MHFNIYKRKLDGLESILGVTIADISVDYTNAKNYDSHGCEDTTTPGTTSKYYLNVQYAVTNQGTSDFTAPTGFIDHAACGTPAIQGFLVLDVQGGIDPNGDPFPVHLNRFATCVIEDSDTTSAATCVSTGPTTNFIQKPSQSMGIKQGGSYGVSKAVRVRFPLTNDQFFALRNSAASTLTFTLSTNKFISDGVARVASSIDGSNLKDVTWEATGQGTSVGLSTICAKIM